MGPTELVQTSDCKVYAELVVYAQVRYGVALIKQTFVKFYVATYVYFVFVYCILLFIVVIY